MRIFIVDINNRARATAPLAGLGSLQAALKTLGADATPLRLRPKLAPIVDLLKALIGRAPGQHSEEHQGPVVLIFPPSPGLPLTYIKILTRALAPSVLVLQKNLQSLPLPPAPLPTLTEASRLTLRRRLGVSPKHLLIYCPSLEPNTHAHHPEVIEASAALEGYDSTRWLIPRGRPSGQGRIPMPPWLKGATALSIADALYLSGAGDAQAAHLYQGLSAPLPILLQCDGSSPLAQALIDAKAGLHLPPGSAPALRVAALSLAADAKLRARLSSSGAAYAKAKLTPEAGASALLQLIHSELTLGPAASINESPTPPKGGQR